MEDGTSSGETTHDLLLALAGRVDDDLLGQARELAAIGEDARAVELVVASLVACRAVLPEPVRAAVVAAARTARSDLDPAGTLPPAHAGDGIEHRFAVPSDDDPVATALLALPSRALAGCTVLLTHRHTPAGVAPGPLPHPVVLVQAPADRPAEVLAYQVAVALERRDVRASVEVLPAGVEPSDYHAAALHYAAPVISPGDEGHAPQERARPAPRSEPEQPREQATGRRRLADTAGLLGSTRQEDRLLGGALPPVRRPEREEPQASEPEDGGPGEAAAETPEAAEASGSAGTADTTETPGTAAAAAVTPSPNPGPSSLARRSPAKEQARAEPAAPPAPRPVPIKEEPPPRPTPRPVPTPTARIRRPSVTPISRASVPNPIPLVRRSGPAPIVRPIPPAARAKPDANADVADDAVETGTRENPAAAQEAPPPGGTARRADTDTSAFDSLRDPLNGPLNEPLLAPLLDPTMREDDPLGAAGRPSRKDAPRRSRGEDDDWTADWFSGSWAMAPSDVEGEPGPQKAPEPDPAPARDTADEVVADPSPRPAPRRPPRHRYLEEPEAAAEPVAEEPPRPEPEPESLPEAPPEPESQDLGLRPESVARLSDADRQLLARLQAELLEGRKPRMPRPGLGTNGVGKNGMGAGGAGNNGSHRSDPPDLAG